MTIPITSFIVFLINHNNKGKIMDTAQAFLADIQNSITKAEKIANSIPRKGLNVYLDKSTMVMQTFADPSAFAHAKKVTARAGQSSCLRNVLDAGGRLQ